MPRINATKRILFDSTGPSGSVGSRSFHQLFAVKVFRSGSAIVRSYSSRVISSAFEHFSPTICSFGMPRRSA
jgi:hypothetical protein